MSGPLFADRAWLTPYPEDEGEIEVWLDPGEGRAEYVRIDQLAALPEVQALIAGAFEAAAQECEDYARLLVPDNGQFWMSTTLPAKIRALTPADALTAIRKRGEG